LSGIDWGFNARLVGGALLSVNTIRRKFRTLARDLPTKAADVLTFAPERSFFPKPNFIFP
jgi:hypothetical protein